MVLLYISSSVSLGFWWFFSSFSVPLPHQHLHPAAHHQHREAARLSERQPLPGGAGANGEGPQRGAPVGVHLPASPPQQARGGKSGEH